MTSGDVLSLRALNRATLARQLLLRRHALKPVAAIERLAGMQAQVPRPPFVGLWSRLVGFKREHLITAIERREAVRGTMMRGTIHLVSRKDFIAWRGALQPMLTRGMQSMVGARIMAFDPVALVAEARSRFETEPCTFALLREHLKARFPTLDERAMGYLVRMQLPLVQTPAPGAPWAYAASASFTVADAWLGEPLSTDTAADALALRYLAAFGPASAKDFQVWSGLQGGGQTFDALRGKLRVFRDQDGRELFDLPKAPRPDPDQDAPVRFLPEFDNLLLAYDDRRRVIATKHRRFVVSKNLLIPATFLVDGVVAGTWSVASGKKDARLALEPFGTLDARSRKALEAEAEGLLRFMSGLPRPPAAMDK